MTSFVASTRIVLKLLFVVLTTATTSIYSLTITYTSAPKAVVTTSFINLGRDQTSFYLPRKQLLNHQTTFYYYSRKERMNRRQCATPANGDCITNYPLPKLEFIPSSGTNTIIDALVTRTLALWEWKVKQQHSVDVDDDAAAAAAAVNNKKVYIAIAGPPGSGKSTLSQQVVDAINQQQQQYQSSHHLPSSTSNSTKTSTSNDFINVTAIVIPMDGYHYTQDQLREMGSQTQPNTCTKSINYQGNELGRDSSFITTQPPPLPSPPSPTLSRTFEDWMKRRGAPDTFDVHQLYTDLQQLQIHGFGSFPIYNRSISDPIPNQIRITTNDGPQIIFVEGNYLLCHHTDTMWDPSPYGIVWDDTWFIDVPIPILKERLVQRHLQNWTPIKEQRFGVGREGAINKVEVSDMNNIQYIYDHHSREFANVLIWNI